MNESKVSPTAGSGHILLSLLIAASLPGLSSRPAAAEGPASLPAPCSDHDPLRRAFFGDLHVHTGLSLDASTMGTRTRPADAYRFARGERIGIQPIDSEGRPMRSVQLRRPLDFAAVTDHAELLGETHICNTPGSVGHDSIVCRLYRSYPRIAFFWMNGVAANGSRHDFCGDDGGICREAASAPWQEIRAAAAEAHDRSDACRFTSFVAYEWTGGAGLGVNFHRNVIFANESVPALPTSFIDAPVEMDFWAQLGRECRHAGTGCDVVVIPHNTNLGGGMMYRSELPDAEPISREEATARMEYEVLAEVMQHKGDSECAPGLGNTDELCGFEKLAEGTFGGRFASFTAVAPVERQFLRNLLKEGLSQEARLGVNPFQFGLIASTDTHLGTPGLVEESGGYPGHGGAGKPPGDEIPVGLPDFVDFNPGGLAGVWAEENSRRSLFAAMMRRETFGTSGPRIQVRLFAGWKMPDDLCGEPDQVARAYATGVPMGGELIHPPNGASGPPVFYVNALADPGVAARSGTPLQRLQIIKGWLEDGALHEKVYDVAGDPDNRASVDIATCEASGSGFGSLCAVWRDPDYDADESAFYYARAVENPTCRWSQQMCSAAGITCEDPDAVPEGYEGCCDPSHRPTVQERAWSSPIWIRPSTR